MVLYSNESTDNLSFDSLLDFKVNIVNFLEKYNNTYLAAASVKGLSPFANLNVVFSNILSNMNVLENYLRVDANNNYVSRIKDHSISTVSVNIKNDTFICTDSYINKVDIYKLYISMYLFYTSMIGTLERGCYYVDIEIIKYLHRVKTIIRSLCSIISKNYVSMI